MIVAPPITRDRSGWYSTPAGRFPSVTTMLHDSIGAPEQLVDWSVKQERDRCARLATQAAIDAKLGHLSVMNIVAFMAERLKGPYAYKGVRDAAATRGTAVHAWIEAHLRAGRATALSEADTAIRVPVEAWLRWADAVQFEATHIEVGLYSAALGVAGTADAIGRVRGRTLLLDWKSGSGIRFAAQLQTALYHAMAVEQGLLDPQSGVQIVRTPWRVGDECEVIAADGDTLARWGQWAHAARVLWQAQQT